jgi:hypothetical protein
MDCKFWSGLIDWLQESLLREKTISKSDLDIFAIVDTPEEAVAIIKKSVIV